MFIILHYGSHLTFETIFDPFFWVLNKMKLDTTGGVVAFGQFNPWT